MVLQQNRAIRPNRQGKFITGYGDTRIVGSVVLVVFFHCTASLLADTQNAPINQAWDRKYDSAGLEVPERILRKGGNCAIALRD
jgi:hypothetical protein